MLSEKRWEELLNYTYETACHLYGDDPDMDMLVQETLLALIKKEQAGEHVERPKGFLSTVLRNKRNDQLRRKYRDSIVTYDFPADLAAEEPEEDLSDEYEAVRREISRLLKIYREVTVRHYMHGQAVEQIARELGIPKGTVLSRLSAARRQIKGGLTTMKAYSEYSYEPKSVSLGIRGNTGYTSEPFRLLSSKIEQNLLILAYEKPISLKDLADAMGMPCAYIEEAVDKLVNGELMGRTSGGLVYTRCFMQRYRDSFGDVAAQERLAADKAGLVMDIVWKHAEPLMNAPCVAKMTDKQKATLLLHVLNDALSHIVVRDMMALDIPMPERPNGGRWLATGSILEANEPIGGKYFTSGPVQVSDGPPMEYMVYDYNSLFGDAHMAYDTKLPFKCKSSSIMRLFASFFTDRVKTDVSQLYEALPVFEEMHILRRDENGEMKADIPGMTFKDNAALLEPVKKAIYEELKPLLIDDLRLVCERFENRVPSHVDEREYFLNYGALNAYVPAQMLAIVEQGLFPYSVTVGETPIILVLYRE